MNRKVLLCLAYGSLLFSCASPAAPVKAGSLTITPHNAVANAVNYEEYDVGEAFYQEEGVSYTLEASYQDYINKKDVSIPSDGLKFTPTFPSLEETFDVHCLIKGEKEGKTGYLVLTIPVTFQDPPEIQEKEKNDLLYGCSKVATYSSLSYLTQRDHLGPSDPDSRVGIEIDANPDPKDWPDVRLNLPKPIETHSYGYFALDVKHVSGDVNFFHMWIWDETGGWIDGKKSNSELEPKGEVSPAGSDWQRLVFPVKSPETIYQIGFIMNTYDRKTNDPVKFYLDNLTYQEDAPTISGEPGKAGYKVENLQYLPAISASCKTDEERSDLYGTSKKAIRAEYTNNPYPDVFIPFGSDVPFFHGGGLFHFKLKFPKGKPDNMVTGLMLGKVDYDQAYSFSGAEIVQDEKEGWYDVTLDTEGEMDRVLTNPCGISMCFAYQDDAKQGDYLIIDDFSYTQNKDYVAPTPIPDEEVQISGDPTTTSYSVSNMEDLDSAPVAGSLALSFNADTVHEAGGRSLKATFQSNPYPALALTLPEGFENHGGTLSLYVKMSAGVQADYLHIKLGEEIYQGEEISATFGDPDADGWRLATIDCSKSSLVSPKYLTILLSGATDSTPAECVYLDQITYTAPSVFPETLVTTGTPDSTSYKLENMENLNHAPIAGSFALDYDSQNIHGSGTHSLKATFQSNEYPALYFDLPSDFENHGGTFSTYVKASSGVDLTGFALKLGASACAGNDIAPTVGEPDADGWRLLSFDCSLSSLLSPACLTLCAHGAINSNPAETIYFDEMTYTAPSVFPETLEITGTPGQSGYSVKNLEKCATITNRSTPSLSKEKTYGASSTQSLKIAYSNNEYPGTGLSLPDGFLCGNGKLEFDFYPDANATNPNQLNIIFGNDYYSPFALLQPTLTDESDGWKHAVVDLSLKTAGSDYVDAAKVLTIEPCVSTSGCCYLDNINFTIA